MPRRPSVPRPTSAAEARSLFEPPAPVVQDVEHRYLNGRWVDLDLSWKPTFATFNVSQSRRLLDEKIISKEGFMTIHQLCRRSRHMSESLGLGDSINHVYLPTVTD